MAEIVWHDARRYTELNPINPHLCNSAGQWRDLRAGDEINVPDDWVQALSDAGYEVHLPAPTPPLPDAVDLLPQPGPKTTGCGRRHTDSPHRSAEFRRGRTRRVEVIFFDEGEWPQAICGAGSGPCDTSMCHLYDPREYEFDYIQPDRIDSEKPIFRIQLFDHYGHPIYGAPYEVTGAGIVKSGISSDSLISVYSAAPQSCHVRWSRPEAERRAQANDPTALLHPFKYEQDVFVNYNAASEDEAGRRRLANLGYGGHGSLEDAVCAFQREGSREASGRLADIAGELILQHDQCAPYRRPKPALTAAV